MNTPRSLEWSSQFIVDRNSTTLRLPGDKILLPPSALEQLLAAAPVVTNESHSNSHGSSFDPFNPYSFAAERHSRAQNQYSQPQLPHPLTFRLVNPDNGRVAYAGIREFSAGDGQAGISQFLAHALGIDVGTTKNDDGAELFKTPRITIHAQELPKGTFVRLRPMEAGYDPEDWKSLLEEHLRKNFTTLTRGEVLTVPAGRSSSGKSTSFEFVIDEFKPEGPGICVVDTDLEVDIEALNEEQARETLRRVAAKRQRASGTAEGSSPGGQLDLFRIQTGQVLEGEYVDYEIPSWIRSQGLEVELTPVDPDEQLALFISTFSARQRARPRDDEHIWNDYHGRASKRIRISPTHVELETAEAVWVSVHTPALSSSGNVQPKHYTIRASAFDPNAPVDDSPDTKHGMESKVGPDEVRCSNCQQVVPQRSLMLHENFCLRNNILCPNGCGQVFQRRSDTWQSHWHCPHDSFWGNSASSHEYHDKVFHTTYSCSNCNFAGSSLPELARHRTSTCPGKLILCQFCHLVVPQEGDPDGEPNVEALLSGLTPHELADGARTTECHLCQRIVRLRDMSAHLKHHDLERKSRPAPRVCRNMYCGRTLDGTSASGDTRAGTKMGQGPGNEIGLCSTCFGPLYVSMHDPEGKALKRRVERRYLSQLLTGCGRSWCRNEYCKNGRSNTGTPAAQAAVPTKDALPMIKPLVDGVLRGNTPLHFCVDETCQRKRTLAEMLAAEGEQRPGARQYGLAWCVGALEAEQGNLDKAREWLGNFAPAKSEER